MRRLLLPFTSDVEMDTLEALVRFAAYQNALLIPLSLVALPTTKRSRVRLELLQQSRDFLEAVRYKAERYQVPIEPVEIFTQNVTRSILNAVEELHCDGLLLATRDARCRLLDKEVACALDSLCTIGIWYRQ